MTPEEKIEFVGMQKKIDHLDRKVDSHGDKLDKIEDRLGEIYEVLIDNKLSKTKGLVSRLEDVEGEVSKYKKWQNGGKFLMAGAMIGAGATLDKIIDVIKKFFFVPIILLLFSGCLTLKNREDIAHRYLRENPKVLADLSRLHFPVTPKIGTPVYIQGVPIITYGVDTLYHKKDTIFVPSKTITIRDTLLRVDTIPDEAAAASLRASNSDLLLKIDRCINSEKESSQRAKNRLYWLIGVSSVFVVFIIVVLKLSGLVSRIKI